MPNPLLARVTSDPAIFGGKPIICGQRFAVEHLLGYLSAGTSDADLLAEFLFLEADDIAAALAYAQQKQTKLRHSGLAERDPESRGS